GLHARWLVGADGLHSSVARFTGLATPATGRRRYGLRRHFMVAPWSEFVEVIWTPAGELYVTPVAPGLVGVALLAERGRRLDDVIRSSSELSDRLMAASPGPLRG